MHNLTLPLSPIPPIPPRLFSKRNTHVLMIFPSSSAEEDVNAYPKEHDDVLSIMIHRKTLR